MATGRWTPRLMVTDTRAAPTVIPLHPAAERFRRQQGYLD